MRKLGTKKQLIIIYFNYLCMWKYLNISPWNKFSRNSLQITFITFRGICWWHFLQHLQLLAMGSSLYRIDVFLWWKKWKCGEPGIEGGGRWITYVHEENKNIYMYIYILIIIRFVPHMHKSRDTYKWFNDDGWVWWVRKIIQ